jgi:hypothetical protein
LKLLLLFAGLAQQALGFSKELGVFYGNGRLNNECLG